MLERHSAPDGLIYRQSQAGSIGFNQVFSMWFSSCLTVFFVMAHSLLSPYRANADEPYPVKGLIVAPGETVQIFLKHRFYGVVPSLLSYDDDGGAMGELELDRSQADANSGTVVVSNDQTDSILYTAPMKEGFDQITIADLYGRMSDPSREFGINIFVVDNRNGDSPAFGIPSQYPGISVENLNSSIVSIPSLGQVSAYTLNSPYTFDGFEAYVLSSGGQRKNLILNQFIFGLAGETFGTRAIELAGGGVPLAQRKLQQSQVKPDCSPMKPGESFESFLQRCFGIAPGTGGGANHGDKKIDDSEPKPIKPPVHRGPIPISSGGTGGHVTGGGTVSWTPPSVTGGPGVSVTVEGGSTWTRTDNATGLIDDQEMKFRRVTRQWDAVKKKWVVIKVEICTQVFRWITIIAPPNPPIRQGPIPVGEPVCRPA